MTEGSLSGERKADAVSRPPAGRVAGGEKSRPLLGLGEWAFVAALGVALAPAVISMSEIWDSVEYASHGYLVPFVALWAATSKRELLRRHQGARDLRGLVVIVAAFLLYFVGGFMSSPTIEGLGAVAALAGAVLFLRGSGWLRTLMFPLGYLVFMVPLPERVLTPIIVNLQLFVSSIGVRMLQLGGIPVFRTGNVIELPGGSSLFVAEACSGITSVITLLPLGVFLAYFTEKTLARRLALVAAVIPLAMAGNLIRVMGTVVAARSFGVETATSGALHDTAGILTYVVGCLALLGVGVLMRRFIPPQGGASEGGASARKAASARP